MGTGVYKYDPRADVQHLAASDGYSPRVGVKQLSGTLCIFVSLGDSLSFAPSSQSPPSPFLTGDYFPVHSSLRILEGRLLEEKALLSLRRMKDTFKLRLEDSLRFGKKLLVPQDYLGMVVWSMEVSLGIYLENLKTRVDWKHRKVFFLLLEAQLFKDLQEVDVNDGFTFSYSTERC